METELLKRLHNLERRIVDLYRKINNDNEGIIEAPEDGNQYGRQDGEWTIIIGSDSATLQELVDDNNTITNNYLNIVDSSSSTYVGADGVIISNNTSSSQLVNLGFNTYIDPTKRVGSLSLNSQPLIGPDLTTGTIHANPNSVESEGNFYLPLNNGGTNPPKVLATVQDLSIQGLVENDIRIGSLDSGQAIVHMLSGDSGSRIFGATISDGSVSTGFTQTHSSITLFANNGLSDMLISGSNSYLRSESSGVGVGGYFISDGVAHIGQTFNGLGSFDFRFETPASAMGTNANFLVPAIPGNHKISIAVTYNDSTIIAKSGTTLNADYPTARPGDKVQCMAITPTPKIYEKTVTGWAEHTVTEVAP